MSRLIKWLCVVLVAIFPLHFVFIVLFNQFNPQDLFSDRISLLQDRPANIERDIVVDLTKIEELGGMAAYSEVIVKYMIQSKPNYRWIILHSGSSYANDELKRFLNERQASNSNVIVVDVKSRTDFLFKWMYYIAKSSIFRHTDEMFSKWLASQSENFNDTFYRFKQMFLHGKVFVDRHCDLIFSLATPLYYFNYGIPQVSVIHDVIYLDAPSILSQIAAATHIRGFVNNFNSSKKIISISYFTKDCVLKYFDNIDADKIEVIRTQMADRLPVLEHDKIEATLQKFGLKRDNYFVFPSRFWVHKNHLGLVNAFAKMLQDHSSNVDSSFKLVLMGGCKDRNGKYNGVAKKVLEAIKEHGIENRVVLTDFTSDIEFQSIISASLAVVNPTFYEGFGMPIAEAMLIQKPVVCSNVASLPEVGGDAAVYFDPYDINDIANKLYCVYKDFDLRLSMIDRGNIQVQKFTNRTHMLQTVLELLDHTMKESDGKNKYAINWDFCFVKNDNR